MNKRILSRVLRCEDGATAILTALLMTVFLWCGALAVDIASLFLDRRTAQGAVDLAAIAAARDPDNAETLARAVLQDNGIGRIQELQVTPGNYRADPATAPELRFTEGAEPFNAVKVALRHEAPLHFAGGLLGVKAFQVGTQAIATTTAQGAFSIGSRLARLDGGVVNAALNGLLGGNIQLSIMDYEALADANIKLFDFMDALATELDIETGTYNSVLQSQATVENVLDALVSASEESGHANASAALRTLGSQSNAWGADVPLDAVVDLGPYGNMSINTPDAGFSPHLNVMQMVSAAAAIANGANQVSLNLGASIPGLANVRVDLAIGEPPQGSTWVTVGETGATVHTAQTRLRIVAELAPGIILPGIAVRIPLYTEVAYAEARLDEVSCGAEPASDATATIAARPGIAELWLGEVSNESLDDFSRRPRVRDAELVRLPLLRVAGRAHAAATNTHETEMSFDWADVEAGTAKSTYTRDSFTTLFASLLGDLDLDITALGLNLGLPGQVGPALRSALTGLTPALDGLVTGLLSALGVTLGEADVRMHGIRCDGSVLVG